MSKFLHISATIYLALIILVRMMAMPISLMEYSWNRNFIAENLCENKGSPEMHCAGKCFLTKKLAKANDSQDAQNQKGSTRITIVDFCESINQPSFSLPPLRPEHVVVLNVSVIPDRTLSSIFRPPIA